MPHALAVLFFVALSFAYFSPMLQGKVLRQHDVSTYKGMSQEVNQYKKQTGEVSLWTNSMFGGMPTYLINTPNSGNIIAKFAKIVTLGLKKPAAHLFLYLFGFYLALLAFRVKPLAAVAGAVAFAFSSYFFIIITAGHVTKAIAIGYMAPIIAGFHLAFNKKPLQGAAMMAFFLALQILTNHIQIVYYTFIILLIYGIFLIVDTIKSKTWIDFVKSSAFLAAGVILSLGVSFTVLYLTNEWGKFSIRGKSELSKDKEDKTSGLDKSYATGWSYGIDETFTLLVPNFKGGASGGKLSEHSQTYKLYEQAQGKSAAKKAVQQQPTYWGKQPVTSGPVYVGAIVCFLFVLGLILVKGRLKWWLLTATILSILLAWGHNFMWFSDLFLDYFPGYNKFRTVSMILVIAEFTMPLLGILALVKIIEGEVELKEFKKAMIWALGITGGLSLAFGVFAGAFSYQGPNDERYFGKGYEVLLEALQADRQSMLQTDAFRSLFFIIVAAVLVWAAFNKKIDKKFIYPAFILLFIIDMWPVNKRYLNNDNFTSAKNAESEFTPSQADQYLLKDKDPDFRVLNLTVDPFNDASTSYFHKSIGGYHGAKMRRYQELIETYMYNDLRSIVGVLQKQDQGADVYGTLASSPVFNMLNTKYFIINPDGFPLYNPGALGNAWFVSHVKWVDNADDEIASLAKFNPANTAIIDKKFRAECAGVTNDFDSTARITLTEYKPNYLNYSYKTSINQVAVFSEIYYPKGWDAFIDGKPAPYFRANYVLRAMVLPAGEHKLEFKFEPKGYSIGRKISIASSVLLLLFCAGAIVLPLVKKES